MASLLKAKRLIWGLIFLLVTATAALSYVSGTRYMLADAVVTQNRRPFRLSMSVGAAFSEPDAPRTLTDLLERADAAIYEQKRARRAAGGVSMAPAAARS
jgi:GGDEF domain-containing protein